VEILVDIPYLMVFTASIVSFGIHAIFFFVIQHFPGAAQYFNYLIAAFNVESEESDTLKVHYSAEIDTRF
jgi:hypothetical protein